MCLGGSDRMRNSQSEIKFGNPIHHFNAERPSRTMLDSIRESMVGIAMYFEDSIAELEELRHEVSGQLGESLGSNRYLPISPAGRQPKRQIL